MRHLDGHERIERLDMRFGGVDAFLRVYVLVTKEETSVEILRLNHRVVYHDELADSSEHYILDGFRRNPPQSDHENSGISHPSRAC